MNRERREEVIAIANGLSNDDICYLINLISERCSVFVGCMGNRQLSSEITWACINGTLIQINLETAEEDLVSEHSNWWREAILEEAKRIRAEERAAKKGGKA